MPMRPRRAPNARRILVYGLAVMSLANVVVSAGWAGTRCEPLTTAELLVTLAQEYALNQKGRQTEADVQQVRALLEAAVRLDARRAEAWAWLYELASLSGDEAGAARYLNGLLEADPAHQGAFALWLAGGVRAQQTVEKRIEWLQQVSQTRRPPPQLAMVHVQLARLAQERLDTETARREVQQALALEPASVEALVLAYQLLDEQAPPDVRLSAALRVLEVSPLSLETAWQVAALLNEYGFITESSNVFTYARSVFRRINPGVAVPAGFLLDFAHNKLALGHVEEAAELARQANEADSPVAIEAGMFLRYLLAQLGRQPQAADVQSWLARLFAGITEPRDYPAGVLAQGAWFYMTIDPQPHRALLLARAAAERAPRDRFVQRVLGWALAENLKNDEAERQLAAVAPQDGYAAARLASLLHKRGADTEARRVLSELDPQPIVGFDHELIARQESELGVADPPTSVPGTAREAAAPDTQPATTSAQTSAPTTTGPATPASAPAVGERAVAAAARLRARHPEVAAALAGFQKEVLKFIEGPARYLDVEVTPEDLAPGPGDPWWATFTLTNRGSFPISLGTDGMVNPVVLVAYKIEGDKPRLYPALTTVSLDAVRVLHPGETTRLRRNLDIGPVRMATRQSPQHAQRVEVHSLLDAEEAPNGQWRLGVCGQVPPAAYFNRVPVRTGPDGLGALFAAFNGSDLPQKFRAIEILAELLGERQQADLKRLSYDPATVPIDRIRMALLTTLGSDSWELRARALDALQVVGLDRELLDAVERCLDHPHWLVRLLAVRVLARQGPAFATRATSIAQNDADDLVRAVADSYAKKWRPPAPPETQKSPAAEDR